MDFTVRILHLRDLPAEKKPEPKPLTKRFSRDDYNLDIFGRHLVINCGDFVVITDPYQELVEVQGVPVTLETNFNLDETTKTRERIGFPTDYCQVSYDRTPSVIRLVGREIRYNEMFEGYRFVFDGITLDVSRRRRHVRVFDLGIKGLFQGRTRIEGPGLPSPRPMGITRDRVDDAKTVPRIDATPSATMTM